MRFLLLIYTHGDEKLPTQNEILDFKGRFAFAMEGLFRAGTDVQIIGLHKHIHFQLNVCVCVCVCLETLVSELSYTHVPVPVLPSASLGGAHLMLAPRTSRTPQVCSCPPHIYNYLQQ